MQAVNVPGLVGEAFAAIGESEQIDEALTMAVRSGERSEQNFARGIIATCSRSLADGWADQLMNRALKENWPDDAVARILLALPATERFMKRATEMGGKVEELYWSEAWIYGLPDNSDLAPWVTEQLLKHGRAHCAVALAGRALARVPDPLLVRMLEEAARSDRNQPDDPSMFQYYVERMFRKLDKSEEVEPDRVARLEWMYLKVLEHSKRPPVTLHKQLASQPQFFVEVLSTIYRSSNEEADPIEEEDREGKAAVASHAWTLLHSWHLVPGSSGGSVDATALENWVNTARRLCHEAGRAEIGDEQIGQMLAWAPGDADGTWPCEAVREVIEITRSRHLESGLYIGVKNKRGTTNRGILDGGEQERDLGKRYRNYSDAVRFEWPRTSAVLDRIAESYEVEGKEHDDDAERRQW